MFPQPHGLAALQAAYESGVRWFDVAPSYGDGAAETILAKFLAMVPEQPVICTKVGFAAAPTGIVTRLLRPTARLLFQAVPASRGLLQGHRPAQRCRLSGEMVRRSLESSLRRLGRERIDVFALHEPLPEDALRDDVVRAVEDAKTAGKIGAAALACLSSQAAQIAVAQDVFDILQVPNNLLAPGLGPVRPLLVANSVDLVTHSVFGSAQSISTVAALLRNQANLHSALRTGGYEGDLYAMAAALLLDYALATNSNGVVLVSMFQRIHLNANLARAALAPNPAAIALGHLILRAAQESSRDSRNF